MVSSEWSWYLAHLFVMYVHVRKNLHQRATRQKHNKKSAFFWKKKFEFTFWNFKWENCKNTTRRTTFKVGFFFKICVHMLWMVPEPLCAQGYQYFWKKVNNALPEVSISMIFNSCWEIGICNLFWKFVRNRTTNKPDIWVLKNV